MIKTSKLPVFKETIRILTSANLRFVAGGVLPRPEPSEATDCAPNTFTYPESTVTSCDATAGSTTCGG